MAGGQIDPARLDGDALTQWYLRSPAEIEQERQAAAAQRYADFFGTTGEPGSQTSGISPDRSLPDPNGSQSGHAGLERVGPDGRFDDGVYRPGQDDANSPRPPPPSGTVRLAMESCRRRRSRFRCFRSIGNSRNFRRQAGRRVRRREALQVTTRRNARSSMITTRTSAGRYPRRTRANGVGKAPQIAKPIASTLKGRWVTLT
jgi:hypothetical protein